MPKTTLQESAMLVGLSISQWTARKYDKKASEEVEKANEAKNAGRFNKLLIDKEGLKEIEKVAGTARELHYRMTLPWGDNGDRLLPASMFLDYKAKMGDLKNQFQNAVAKFVRDYDSYRDSARQRLGKMYNAMDYPASEAIRDRFAFAIYVTPIPSENDFRVQLNEGYVKEVQRELRERMEEQSKRAVQDLWDRTREVVERIHERLSDSDKIFRDSLIENARELVEILPGLNFTKDPDIDKIATEVKGLLVSPDRLRNEKTLRSDVADKAADILSRLPKLA